MLATVNASIHNLISNTISILDKNRNKIILYDKNEKKIEKNNIFDKNRFFLTFLPKIEKNIFLDKKSKNYLLDKNRKQN